MWPPAFSFWVLDLLTFFLVRRSGRAWLVCILIEVGGVRLKASIFYSRWPFQRLYCKHLPLYFLLLPQWHLLVNGTAPTRVLNRYIAAMAHVSLIPGSRPWLLYGTKSRINFVSVTMNRLTRELLCRARLVRTQFSVQLTSRELQLIQRSQGKLF